MNDENPNASRLESLESRVAHQEQEIAELNDSVLSQWRKIDALERQVAKLLDEIQNLRPPRETPEPPPPHY